MESAIRFSRQNLTPKSLARKTTTDKCLILDLDETLIHTFEETAILKKLKPHKIPALRPRIYHKLIDEPDDSFEMWGVTRPHLEDFLDFCFSYFKIVAVWSAGTTRYVEEIVDLIFPVNSPPHIIFTRSDCEMIDDVTKKSLFKMIETEPLLKDVMTIENTLIIDDRCDVWDVCPLNVIQLPAYVPQPTIELMLKDDIALEQIRWWLIQPEVIKTKDTRMISRSDIFTTSISEYKQSLSTS